MQVILLRGLLGTMRGLRLPVSALDGFIHLPPLPIVHHPFACSSSERG